VDPTSIGLVVIVAIIVGTVYWAFAGQCPWCKRIFAMRKTGAYKYFDEEMLHGSSYEEWLCGHCGYREWKKKQENGSGGGS